MKGKMPERIRMPVDMATLEAELHGQRNRPIGVLLLDIGTNKLYCKISDEIGQEDEVLALLEDDLMAKSDEMGGEAVLQLLEDQLSNVLRITDRERILVEDPVQALDQIFSDRVLRQAG